MKNAFVVLGTKKEGETFVYSVCRTYEIAQEDMWMAEQDSLNGYTDEAEFKIVEIPFSNKSNRTARKAMLEEAANW